jgi:D-lactate dehydrogenase
MKMAVFGTHEFDRTALDQANELLHHDLVYFEPALSRQTVALAKGFPAVCVFVRDRVDEETLTDLRAGGTTLVALRCAGFNNVDLAAAGKLGVHVVRVPEYSPYAVAEHAMALLLALNRKLPRAYNRVRDGNFSLDGLVGFDLHGKTIGVIGLGRIGAAFARIVHGFGCRVLGSDVQPNEQLQRETGVLYVDVEQVYEEADAISLHVPLTPKTFHLINRKTLARMKKRALLINTSRGALVNAADLLEALKAGVVAGAGLDVYEEEDDVFFRDLSGQVLQDDILARLLSCSNVLITSHQGFLTKEALENIAATTLENLKLFSEGLEMRHELTVVAR